MMAAIFLGMLPVEYQKMALRSHLGKEKGVPKYEDIRDYVLMVGQQEGQKGPP